MAGKAKNQEVGPQGGTVTLDIYVHQYEGGPLVDPDNQEANYEIFDPDGVSVETGTATRVSIGQYQVIYSIEANAVISDEWRVEWSMSINGAPVQGSELFRVVAAASLGFGSQSNIAVADEWYNLIVKVIGYPDVDRVLLSREQVIALCLWPAMQHYFHKFPKKDREQVEIGTNATLEIDFPDQWTYGVLDVRVVGKGSQTGGSGGGFWDLVFYNKYSGYSAYGTGYGGVGGYSNQGMGGYNPGFTRQISYEYKHQLDTIANRTTSKYRVIHEDRKLAVYSSISSEVAITWAKFSADFEDVKYARRMDVIQLAQAELLDHLADTTGLIVDQTAEITVDAGTLRTRAEDLRNSVLEKWAEWPDVILLRLDGQS
jgi:hypothetical protein